MDFFVRLSAKIGSLIDSTCDAVERHPMLKGGIVLITGLAIGASVFLYVQNERAHYSQAQKLCETTKQRADQLPASPQATMASRLAGLAKKRLDWVDDVADPLYKQLIRAAQIELARKEIQAVADSTQEWDREFKLFLDVLRQIVALPESSEKTAADDLLSKAANRLVVLPYRDHQGYADKDVQHWFEDAAWWADAAERKGRQPAVDSSELVGRRSFRCYRRT